ncbi:MAG TPA: YggS family pyridoxal phosphate-dependent enzyme [Terriglobia bacterium]
MASGIAENIARVQERLASACERAGRHPEDVRLVAVTKTVPPERIREAYTSGLRDFGENRVQEAASKRGALADLAITWHLIGHLQSNKAKSARELFQWVHSVDSFRVAERLHRASAGADGSGLLEVLIEANLGGEATKSGIAESAALELAGQIGQLDTLRLCGWMLVPPYFDEPEASRPYFFRLRQLAKMINSAGLPGVSTGELSMGMSHDFEVAIEEGATIVRVGTAIFGTRPG